MSRIGAISIDPPIGNRSSRRTNPHSVQDVQIGYTDPHLVHDAQIGCATRITFKSPDSRYCFRGFLFVDMSSGGRMISEYA